MKLLDLLRLIDEEAFTPATVNEDGSYRKLRTVFEVTILFNVEEPGVTCNIDNEILIPWYDCKILNITPHSENRNSICVWLDYKEYIQKKLSCNSIKKVLSIYHKF